MDYTGGSLIGCPQLSGRQTGSSTHWGKGGHIPRLYDARFLNKSEIMFIGKNPPPLTSHITWSKVCNLCTSQNCIHI